MDELGYQSCFLPGRFACEVTFHVSRFTSYVLQTVALFLLVSSAAAVASTNENPGTASGSSTNQATRSSFVVVLSDDREAVITPDLEKFRKEPLLKQYDIATFQKACRRHIPQALKENPNADVKEVAFYRMYVRGLQGESKPPILLKIGDFAAVTVQKRN